jgi:hypothetical protein
MLKNRKDREYSGFVGGDDLGTGGRAELAEVEVNCRGPG